MKILLQKYEKYSKFLAKNFFANFIVKIYKNNFKILIYN